LAKLTEIAKVQTYSSMTPQCSYSKKLAATAPIKQMVMNPIKPAITLRWTRMTPLQTVVR